MKRFSDFARNEMNLDGEKVALGDVFGHTIVVFAFRTMQSRFKPERECVQIQFEMDGERHVTFTTSGVIISQLRAYEAELPYETVIRREGKYFTLS